MNICRLLELPTGTPCQVKIKNVNFIIVYVVKLQIEFCLSST